MKKRFKLTQEIFNGFVDEITEDKIEYTSYYLGRCIAKFLLYSENYTK